MCQNTLDEKTARNGQQYQYTTESNLMITQQQIDSLFDNKHFVTKFQHLQLHTFENSASHQIAKYYQHDVGLATGMGAAWSLKLGVGVEVDRLVDEISDLIFTNFKEAMYKETNTIYENKLTYMHLTEEIDALKQSLNRLSQTTSFAFSTKTKATQQSSTPQKSEPLTTLNKNEMKEAGHENRKAESSIFMDEEESSIDMGKKNFADDRVANFSFMNSFNSFLNENKISAQDEEIINERINASISKVESSIEDRIHQLEKEFTRRIEQVMKTMGNFIQMINQNDRFNHQSPFTKDKDIKDNKGSKGNKEKKEVASKQETKQQSVAGSRSATITPKLKKQEVGSTGSGNRESKNLLNRSGKFASFFGLGRLNLID